MVLLPRLGLGGSEGEVRELPSNTSAYYLACTYKNRVPPPDPSPLFPLSLFSPSFVSREYLFPLALFRPLSSIFNYPFFRLY